VTGTGIGDLGDEGRAEGAPVSNTGIVKRLEAFADAVELGEMTVNDFRDGLLGQIEALERLPYSHVKEAQWVWAELTRAIEAGQAELVDVHALGDWLRRWTAKVPCGPA
jgi:hypothetical protein